MKRIVTTALIVVVVLAAFAACTRSDKTAASPAATTAQGDPHAGIWKAAIPAGAGHRGRVVDVLDAGEYTYIQVAENGKKLWVAVMSTKVSKGDEVEFPDAPAFTNFQSKILNRTFDTLIFAAGVRDNGPK